MRLCCCCRVFPASLSDLDRHRDRPETGSSDSTTSPPTQKQAFVKLRGLPFASTAEKVLEFLGPDVDVLNRAEVGTTVCSSSDTCRPVTAPNPL